MELTVLKSKRSSGSMCASTSCGTSTDKLDHLPDHIRQKVQDHPCYSEEAHHHFARMHVAVAPACNIQCNYCNRKYDCANESRPGVVSELLTPEQAAKKTVVVAANIPQMSVLGIAGPGDPLANPQRTFDTLHRVANDMPDVKLCVSTNGLTLPDHVDELASLNVDHVTITINCVDPEIGAKIYPWIFWNHRRVRGIKGAKILLRQQLRGLEMLVERGVLVKVNSVLIPGVNDEHLKEVNRVVIEKGAFLHNIMPLIARPEHGTYYGVTGQREPTATELRELQDACGDANIMRHCRQCRADAVGMLGEDRGDEFTLDKIENMTIDMDAALERRARVRTMISNQREAVKASRERAAQRLKPAPEAPAVLMAVATSGGGIIDKHFGSVREFLVYEVSTKGVRFIGPRRTDQYCTGPAHCGEADLSLEDTVKALADCRAILCAKIGFKPWKRLEAAGIQPNGEHADKPIEDSIATVYREMLENGQIETTEPADLRA